MKFSFLSVSFIVGPCLSASSRHVLSWRKWWLSALVLGVVLARNSLHYIGARARESEHTRRIGGRRQCGWLEPDYRQHMKRELIGLVTIFDRDFSFSVEFLLANASYIINFIVVRIRRKQREKSYKQLTPKICIAIGTHAAWCCAEKWARWSHKLVERQREIYTLTHVKRHKNSEFTNQKCTWKIAQKSQLVRGLQFQLLFFVPPNGNKIKMVHARRKQNTSFGAAHEKFRFYIRTERRGRWFIRCSLAGFVEIHTGAHSGRHIDMFQLLVHFILVLAFACLPHLHWRLSLLLLFTWRKVRTMEHIIEIKLMTATRTEHVVVCTWHLCSCVYTTTCRGINWNSFRRWLSSIWCVDGFVAEPRKWTAEP